MFNYIVRRLVGIILTLIAISVISFGLIFASPGDPALLLIQARPGLQRDTTQIAKVRKQYRLNQPLHIQYLSYMSKLLRGDLGYSYYYKRPTTELLLEKFPQTALLAVAIMITALGLGLPIGLLMALRRRSVIDRLLTVFGMMLISVPPFFLGLMLIFVFAFQLRLLPASGYSTPMHAVLPVLSVALPLSVGYFTYLRSNLLNVMSADYVRTARAKGLQERVISFRHMLRNALLPVVTQASLDLAYLLTGIVLIETIFNWPGIGLAATRAAQQKDIPVLMGSILFGGLLIGIGNLIADIIAARLDPRVNLQ